MSSGDADFPPSEKLAEAPGASSDSGGAPGTAGEFRIRGAGSISGYRPVVFIDGVRYNIESMGNFAATGAGLTGLGVPATARAQTTGKLARVGYITSLPSNSPVPDLWRQAFVDGLRQHGWKEHENITIERTRTK